MPPRAETTDREHENADGAETSQEATRPGELMSFAERLVAIRDTFGTDLVALNEAIERFRAELQAPAQHLLQHAGKRLRPMCVLLGSRLGGRAFDPVVCDLAMASELVHAATLLHDDVIDEGTERRGAPAARMVYGNSRSILAGDHMLIKALKAVHGVGYPQLLASLLDVIAQMVTGEAMQLARRGVVNPDKDASWSIIRGKTAVLFGWALEAGAVAGGLSPAQVDLLRGAGIKVGLAFQLIDDVIDFTGDGISGKDPLADLKQGKLTWPVLEAIEDDPGLRVELATLAAQDRVSEEQSRAIRERVRATTALQRTRALASDQTEKALTDVRTLPASKIRTLLEVVITDIAERKI